MTYFNTTHERGKQLAEYEGCAVTQEDRVLELFSHNPGVPFSPSQVWAALNMQGVPITSVRRAITTLTSRRKLVKTSIKAKGMYGHAEYCWRLAGKNDQLRLI